MAEDDSAPAPPADGSTPGITPPDPTGDSGGFSTIEKVAGAVAGYEAPLITSLVASAMLHDETDPAKRRQLLTLRKAALWWWGIGAVAVIIALIVIFSVASSKGLAGGCKGGPDKFDPLRTTYTSSDNVHWTATYPCVDGGSTTVSIPASLVPGGGLNS